MWPGSRIHEGLVIQVWTWMLESFFSKENKCHHFAHSFGMCASLSTFVQSNTQDLKSMYVAFSPISQKTKWNHTKHNQDKTKLIASSFLEKTTAAIKTDFWQNNQNAKTLSGHIEILLFLKNLFQTYGNRLLVSFRNVEASDWVCLSNYKETNYQEHTHLKVPCRRAGRSSCIWWVNCY